MAEVVEFIEGLVPTYLREVVSMEEYEELLVPRYSPKMLYFTKEDEAPLNIRKLSTIFTLRLDVRMLLLRWREWRICRKSW